jgi:hypothetical protein
MFSDFIQVLHSARKFYPKNYYFPMHILFTTISLLQKKRLNLRNYSKQEFITELFYELLEMILTCMQNFRLFESIDIYKKIMLVHEFLEFCTIK